MTTSNGTRVIAIGIDAAEPEFVRQLIERGEAPALQSLLQAGQWLDVRSPANIGSGAVWPTFISGAAPTTHGIYSEWRWHPETMSLSRYHGSHLNPFWTSLTQPEMRVGIFDVPFALATGMPKGFEVCEWWSHDATGAGLQVNSNEILSIVKQFPAHPLAATQFVKTTPDTQGNLEAMTAACIEGVRLRGALAKRLISETKTKLALLVFPEVHHASHDMWHTLEPEHQLYQGRDLSGESAREPLLKQVYRAVAQEIGELIDWAGKDATILVFSLHGMRPALGIPAFLGALLCEWEFSRLQNWQSQSWNQRALSLLAATKRRTPVMLKQLYYELTPTVATHTLARPTMLPVYDWENTRAFSLPTDQHGWIRINLIGREAQGRVAANEYAETCKQLEEKLLGLTTTGGQRLVRDITRTAADVESALDNPLPDLVVHWQDAAFSASLKIKDSSVQVDPIGKRASGQHSPAGFCIYRGSRALNYGNAVEAKDFGGLITALL